MIEALHHCFEKFAIKNQTYAYVCMLHLPKIFKWIELYYHLHPLLGLGDEINGRKKGVLFMHVICMNSKKDY